MLPLSALSNHCYIHLNTMGDGGGASGWWSAPPENTRGRHECSHLGGGSPPKGHRAQGLCFYTCLRACPTHRSARGTWRSHVPTCRQGFAAARKIDGLS